MGIKLYLIVILICILLMTVMLSIFSFAYLLVICIHFGEMFKKFLLFLFTSLSSPLAAISSSACSLYLWICFVYSFILFLFIFYPHLRNFYCFATFQGLKNLLINSLGQVPLILDKEAVREGGREREEGRGGERRRGGEKHLLVACLFVPWSGMELA